MALKGIKAKTVIIKWNKKKRGRVKELQKAAQVETKIWFGVILNAYLYICLLSLKIRRSVYVAGVVVEVLVEVGGALDKSTHHRDVMPSFQTDLFNKMLNEWQHLILILFGGKRCKQ